VLSSDICTLSLPFPALPIHVRFPETMSTGRPAIPQYLLRPAALRRLICRRRDFDCPFEPFSIFLLTRELRESLMQLFDTKGKRRHCRNETSTWSQGKFRHLIPTLTMRSSVIWSRCEKEEKFCNLILTVNTKRCRIKIVSMNNKIFRNLSYSYSLI